MSFDEQAGEFDERAGLEPAAGRNVARAIAELSALTPDPIVLDIGAGTGAVGWHLAAFPVHYIGMDLSRPMLEAFRRKVVEPATRLLLVQVDCARSWPIGDQTVAVIFASRVVHLLPVDHVLRESLRVCRSGGYFLMGRVTRDAHSFRSRLQQQKRAILAEHGVPTREGAKTIQRIVAEAVARGAAPLERRTVAEWTRIMTPRQVLSAWEAKPLLSSAAGVTKLDTDKRAAIVAALTGWARDEWGDLDGPQSYTERYTIEGVRLPFVAPT